MKQFNPIYLLLIVGFLSSCQTNRLYRLQKQATVSDLVKEISSDKYEGRDTGSSGMQQAQLFVESYLKANGVAPLWNNSYKDTITIYKREAYNLVGVIEAEEKTDKYLLIGAHLDHIGKLDSGSKLKLKSKSDSDLESDSIFNGANDNASGVATILTMAKELQNHKLKQNVIVALFTAEEKGLIGSSILAKRLSKEGFDIRCMINIDMVGAPLNRTPGQLFITGHKRSNFADTANRLLSKELFLFNQVEHDRGLFAMSDNYYFYRIFKIPAHTISTFQMDNYDHYHRLSDEYSNIDRENLELIAKDLSSLIVKLATSYDTNISLTKEL